MIHWQNMRVDRQHYQPIPRFLAVERFEQGLWQEPCTQRKQASHMGDSTMQETSCGLWIPPASPRVEARTITWPPLEYERS